ncbi:MAG: type II toxin-antitoxin system VapC family toxin [Mycobacteriales bacterium]
MLYLDTSALVKTVRPEDESAALNDFLRLRPSATLFTSQLAITELSRAVTVSVARDELPARLDHHLDLVRDRLEAMRLVTMTQDLLLLAGRLGPSGLRTLDAIHLATALQFRDDLTVLVTYNHRLAAAAAANGLQTAAPGQTQAH